VTAATGGPLKDASEGKLLNFGGTPGAVPAGRQQCGGEETRENWENTRGRGRRDGGGENCLKIQPEKRREQTEEKVGGACCLNRKKRPNEPPESKD